MHLIFIHSTLISWQQKKGKNLKIDLPTFFLYMYFFINEETRKSK
jgi:hypothetical protein